MKKILFILLLVILLTGCAKPDNKEDNNSIVIKDTNKGVGFINSGDFKQSLFDADKSGSYIGFYAPFDPAGKIPELVLVAYENPLKLSSKPIVNINFFSASTGRELSGYNKEIYKKQLVDIAAKYKPEYLGIGNEINLYNGDMDAAIKTQNEIYTAIKGISPGTKVFTVFQYEHLDDVSFVDKFKLDVVGITTYPFIKGYSSSTDIPQDYYGKLSNIKKPIIFTEIGHNSVQSEADQSEFVDVFYDRLSNANIKPEIVIWGLLYDYPQKGNVWNAGLFTKDGKEKLVYRKWAANGK